MTCLCNAYRSFTDLRRFHSLFSLATPSVDNQVLIFNEGTSDKMDFIIRGNHINFRGNDYKLNKWQSICATWDSVSGLAQLWLDGKPTTRRFISSGSNISGPIIMVLGQVRF